MPRSKRCKAHRPVIVRRSSAKSDTTNFHLLCSLCKREFDAIGFPNTVIASKGMIYVMGALDLMTQRALSPSEKEQVGSKQLALTPAQRAPLTGLKPRRERV